MPHITGPFIKQFRRTMTPREANWPDDELASKCSHDRVRKGAISWVIIVMGAGDFPCYIPAAGWSHNMYRRVQQLGERLCSLKINNTPTTSINKDNMLEGSAPKMAKAALGFDGA